MSTGASPHRCWWCGDAPEYVAYHDDEWGRPVDGERALFELLALEGFQAGLSWHTILRKRTAFRAAFAGFEPEAVAAFGAREVARLLADAGIVRHRGKIEATIGNARALLALHASGGSLAALAWAHEPDTRARPPLTEDAARALRPPAEATALSRALQAAGFRFVGPTTVYAFMQAAGLVNDHVRACAWWESSERARAGFRRPPARHT
ncbi:MAG: DNA-3-methyladenine glycosylase I [Gemmatimonadales bacterium]|nr:DNA-3-methyladenine glycosylase I [Gemmatimonadales bacterium]